MLKNVNGTLEPVEVRFVPNMEEYHAANNAYMSTLVKTYLDRHGEPKDFFRADIADLYALSIERNNGMLEVEDMIKIGFIAGLAIAERENKTS